MRSTCRLWFWQGSLLFSCLARFLMLASEASEGPSARAHANARASPLLRSFIRGKHALTVERKALTIAHQIHKLSQGRQTADDHWRECFFRVQSWPRSSTRSTTATMCRALHSTCTSLCLAPPSRNRCGSPAGDDRSGTTDSG